MDDMDDMDEVDNMDNDNVILSMSSMLSIVF